MEKEHILVVDDEEGLLHLVKMRLTAMGFAVTGCTSGRDAMTYGMSRNSLVRPIDPNASGAPSVFSESRKATTSS